MVEGHSVHRIAKKTVGKSMTKKEWKTTSPNGRFTDGAAAIDGQTFVKLEAIGKNLFGFFTAAGGGTAVVRVHFGMSGRWGIFDVASAPEPTPTTRLRFEGHGIVSHVSAMSVEFGGIELWDKFRAKLGQDPLRDDADPEVLWTRVRKSRKDIGGLLMDQGCFPGVGNIYRAEICFAAGIHPTVKGNTMSRTQFDRVWGQSVRLMRMGYESGRIITVEKAEAIGLGRPNLRRFVYNQAKCARCGTSVVSWKQSTRTVFACGGTCQPRNEDGGAAVPVRPLKDVVVGRRKRKRGGGEMQEPKLMNSRYKTSSCGGCGKGIEQGNPIIWQRGRLPMHQPCWQSGGRPTLPFRQRKKRNTQKKGSKTEGSIKHTLKAEGKQSNETQQSESQAEVLKGGEGAEVFAAAIAAASRKQLQQAAKALGIRANQKTVALRTLLRSAADTKEPSFISSVLPLLQSAEKVGEKVEGPAKLFRSHCVSEPLSERRRHPEKLSVAELRTELKRRGLSPKGLQDVLRARLASLLADLEEHTADLDMSGAATKAAHGYHKQQRGSTRSR